MTKKLTSLVLALVMCLSLCIPAFAADTAPSADDATTIIDLTTAGFFDSEIPLTVFPRIGVNTDAPRLKNGEYRIYSNSDGTPFYISAGTTVYVTIETDVSSSLQIGYLKVGGSYNPQYSEVNRTKHPANFEIPTSGEYKIWIRNIGSDSCKVTDGSIEF